MLNNPKGFFDHCRKTILGPALVPDEVEGCEAILAAMEGSPVAHAAYALATAFHETNHTMQPVREIGGRAYFFKMYDPQGSRPALAKANGNIHPGDGAKFYGRGYPQLTWRGNYERTTKRLQELGFDVDLVANPDLAMRPDIAAVIMRRGMDEGWFTGKGFRHFLPAEGLAQLGQFVMSRKIINGLDRANLIAGYAINFQLALIKGGWA